MQPEQSGRSFNLQNNIYIYIYILLLSKKRLFLENNNKEYCYIENILLFLYGNSCTMPASGVMVPQCIAQYMRNEKETIATNCDVAQPLGNKIRQLCVSPRILGVKSAPFFSCRRM